MDTLNLTDQQKVELHAQFRDASGNATGPNGAPAWAVDNTSLVQLQPLDGGLSCEVTALGPTGTATVTCSDTNSAGDTFSDTVTIVIGAGEASQLQVTADAPASK